MRPLTAVKSWGLPRETQPRSGPPGAEGELPGRDQPKLGQKLLLLLLRGKPENTEPDLGKDPFEAAFDP